MDNRPTLSQYFGEADTPPASQFFDEIASTPASMIQSVYLGDGDAQETTAENLFPGDMTASFSQPQESADMSFTNLLASVSANSTVPATSLPDPSTFFDILDPEPQIGPVKSSMSCPDAVSQAMDGLSLKTDQPDKEADRRRDAWIPSDEAKKTLMKAQSSPKGSFFPEREVLTMPGLIMEEELADSLHEAAVKHLGVSAAGSRVVMRAERVSRDEAGLRELLRTGSLRAAFNLTAHLLNSAGQGSGRIGRPTKHTPRTLQLWLTRFALMVKIRLNEALVQESEPFGDFSKPDMFYQFYPETYGERAGSLVPFALRLLVAEVPGHVGKPEQAIDRLYLLLATVQEMLANLREDKTEDGSEVITSEQDKAESLKLWSTREIRVLHSIINCAIALKDYRLAEKLLTSLLERATTPQQSRDVESAMCRMRLHAGQRAAAAAHLTKAAQLRQLSCPTPDVREYVDLGLMDVASGKYQDAYRNFARAAEQEPTNILVANNSAVCLLYMGRLKEAIAVLQKAINSDPERGLNENLILNLTTLYELECSHVYDKKLNILKMLCKYKSDTMVNVLECLKLNHGP